jgi:hypothetical protein
MKIRRYVVLMALIVALAMINAACGSDEPTATPVPPADTPTPTAPTATPVPGAPTPTPAPTSTPQPAATPTPSFDAEAHFKGKTIRLVVGFNPGGGTDTQSRYLSSQLPKFIPGKPRIVVSNLTPSIAANNFVWESAKDGSVLSYTASYPIQQATDPNSLIGKAGDFMALGSAVGRNAVWMINGEELPYKDITEAQGASGPTLIAAGSAPTPQELTGVNALGMFLLADWLNLPFEYKLVASTGTEQSLLMFERGDINTFSAGSVWYQLPNRRPGWVSSGFVKPFTGLTGPGGMIQPNSEIDSFDAPLARDLLNAEQQAIWDGLMGAEMLGKTWIAPPGTPMEIVNVLRQAWQDLIADTEIRAGFEKLLGQPVEIFSSGAELQEKIVATETAFLERYSTLEAVQNAVYEKYIN